MCTSVQLLGSLVLVESVKRGICVPFSMHVYMSLCTVPVTHIYCVSHVKCMHCSNEEIVHATLMIKSDLEQTHD